MIFEFREPLRAYLHYPRRYLSRHAHLYITHWHAQWVQLGARTERSIEELGRYSISLARPKDKTNHPRAMSVSEWAYRLRLRR